MREAEQVELLDAEVLAQRLDVGDVRGERVVVGRIRAVRAARAEKHELERVVEAGEVTELGGRPAGTAGWQTSSGPFPRRSYERVKPVGRAEDLDHGSLPSTTLSRPVRSAVIATSVQPSRSSIAATPPRLAVSDLEDDEARLRRPRESLVLAAGRGERPPAPSAAPAGARP